jgi:Transposase DDE domain
MNEHLQKLLAPLVYDQQAHYRSLGLRERILTLPLMVAAVVTLLWSQVPSVHELTRMLNHKDLLWAKAVKVRQQSLSERFLSFPAELFERVFEALIPLLRQRWQERTRPIPGSIKYGLQHFQQILAADGSVLEALFRKLDSLQAVAPGTLAGKMCTVIELTTRLPLKIWFHENSKAHDSCFWDDLLAWVSGKTLLVLDRGFYDFEKWAQLIHQQVDFICAGKSNLAYTVVTVFSATGRLKDQLIQLAPDSQGQPLLTLRLIEVRKGKGYYRYLTSVTAPEILPPDVVVDLYCRRWRIEEAFLIAKRLLGLAYLWTGSLNGIQLQIWATWLMYAVLVDLSDAVAQVVQLPLERISMEMVWRGLYYFNDAYQKGKALDPVAYLAAPENRDLGVIKSLRKPPKELDFRPLLGFT